MRCLWITMADPVPADNGQHLYSAGLIDSLAGAGARLDVLALNRPDSPRRDGQKDEHAAWHLGGAPLPRWTSLASRLPHLANRCATRTMKAKLARLLEDVPFDWVMMDGISSGWALETARRVRGKFRLAYVSHNREDKLRRQVADNQEKRLRRMAMRHEAQKVAELEHSMVEASNLVTAITEEDACSYRTDWPAKAVEVVPPGFKGPVEAGRRVTTATPRRAVMVGSFDWIAKRMNLEEFLTHADAAFAAHGVELQVIGTGPEGFFAEMEECFPHTRFFRAVDDVFPYLGDARIALVPERSGGGFKLKLLDYVFSHTPVFALDGSVAGVPLADSRSIRLFGGHEALVSGVIAAIDDVAALNRQQEAAFAACSGKFDWSSRGAQLVAALDGGK